MQLTFFSLLTILSLVGNVSAATPSSTPANTIDDLKERLATKVAQLRQSQRKAISGYVKDVTVSTFTVEVPGSDMKIELTDDIKVFQTIKSKRTTLTSEDIAKGDFVTVFGNLDTGLDLLHAKVVVIQNPPLTRISGTVTAIDRSQFTASVSTVDGQVYTVDIEKATNIQAFDKEKGLVKGGFSKLETGITAHIVGSPVPKKDHRISALRIIDLGNFSGVTPTPTQEATVSATPTP